MSLYNKHADIDLTRQKSDLMYHMIVNTEASTLDEFCNNIVKSILSKYKKPSIRLQQMLKKVTSDKDRIAKHALLLFALYQEKETQDIFLNNGTPRVPPEKFKQFVDDELPPLVDKLMKGAFTSLRAFVEDARWAYVTL
jgi:hypothetical protein